ncbi:MAG TPA: hypothetical protein VGB49_07410, partial [Caulobacteraceae bacterium]
LPRFIAAEEPELVRVLPDKVSLTRSLWLTTHADIKDLARIRAVNGFVVEAVKAAQAAFAVGAQDD